MNILYNNYQCSRWFEIIGVLSRRKKKFGLESNYQTFLISLFTIGIIIYKYLSLSNAVTYACVTVSNKYTAVCSTCLSQSQ